MTDERISLTQANGIARITLARPETMNLISGAFTLELAEIAKRIEAESSVRAVIMTGAGNVFSAGGDLKDFLANRDGLHGHVLKMAGHFHEAILTLQRIPAPLIVGINGTAAGGGFSLALGGDLILAKKSAKLVSAYTRLGLSPDGGGTWFLPRLVGRQRAFELMSSNRTLSADEAREVGIVSRVVEDSEFEAVLQQTAEQIIALPNGVAGRLKRLLHHGELESLKSHLQAEAESIADMIAAPGTLPRLEQFLAKAKK